MPKHWEEHVVYQDLREAQKIWIRPLKVFQEEVLREGLSIPRFRYLKKELSE